MKRHLLVNIVPLLCLSIGCHSENAQRQRPNILLINIDDLGWADSGCNGSEYYETPNIDRLRESGIWFSQSYAGSANSAPSRACLLTGMYTPRHGIFTVGDPNRGKAKDRKLISIPNRLALADNIQILPRILHDAGYQTFHVGKWHVTADPKDCGVDINIGGNSAGHPKSYFSPYHNKNLVDGPEGEYLPDRLGQEAARLIMEADPQRPFFLYYATYAVHTPLQAPQELIHKYKNKKTSKAHGNPVYAALLESTDKNVGRVLQAVKDSGQEDNTLIIFITDNGGVYDISKQWPLRAGKGSFYEGGIRTPLIIYQKNRFEHKEIKDIAVSQLDIFPTLMDVCHIKNRPDTLDGVSLLPLLENNKTAYLKKRPIFWHFPAYLEGGNKETTDPIFRTRPVTVVRQGDWKLIRNYETETYELYNLKKDISEKNDLSEQYPKIVNKLSKKMEQWIKSAEAPIPTLLNPKYGGRNQQE